MYELIENFLFLRMANRPLEIGCEKVISTGCYENLIVFMLTVVFVDLFIS